MKGYFFESKLGKSRFKLADGSLLCKDVPIARTGIMDYSSLDFEGEPNFDAYPQRTIKISRGEKVLFAPETIASFEAMAFTDDHPREFITPDNWSRYAKGHIQNVRRGTGENAEMVIADIIVKDSDTIDKIESGKTELSCGYNATYEFTSNDTGEQTSITGNHLSLVDRARGGERLQINTGDAKMSKRLLSKLFKDKEDIEKEIKDALEDDDTETTTNDSDDVNERLSRLESAIEKLLKGKTSTSDSDDDQDDKETKDKRTKDKKSKDSDDEEGENKRNETEDSAMSSDDAHKASLIVPHMTFTQGGVKGKRKVLDAAMQTNDRAELVRGIVGNQGIDKLSDGEINIAFNAIAEAAKKVNSPLMPTRDAQTQEPSIADLNENFWRGQK